MRTSVTCRVNPPPNDPQAGMSRAGFTLLEMIVVLATLGLATALAVPAMLRGIESWRQQAAIDVLLDGIRALPADARARGQPIVIDETSLRSGNPPLRIAGDWTLSVPTPWRVGVNGVCAGGDMVVAGRYGEKTIRVSTPFCEAKVLP